ncbi:MAG: hypothetical protein RI973_1971 [Bacteroidota bacterium]|jgi:gliding motility-associated-like protein
MNIKITLWCCGILLLPACQLQAQFHLNGDATQFNDTCWTLTSAQFNKAGSIWNLDKINLNNSFQVIMELQFGCKDADGADGILFGFQPISTSIGQTGEGLGFQGVSPSIGIEFDTWQNGNLSDPAYDHIAISKNGNLDHSSTSNLDGPIQANPVNPNIEDCNWHKLRVNWDAPNRTLEVWFDCSLRLSYTGDIVQEVFNGDPWVFWGFTAATGGASNLQQVCYSYTTFLDGFEDVTICPGGQYQLRVGGGVKYQWSPSTGLSNPSISNPIAAPAETTTYIVEVTDACNNPFYDSITVFVDGDTVFFDLGPDTSLCEGQLLQLDATSFALDTVTYQWASGQTTPGLQVSQPGYYAVTVTLDHYCVSDDRIGVSFIPTPQGGLLGPDTVLCLEQVLELDLGNSGSFDFIWEDGSTLPDRSLSSPGIYSVRVSNVCGEAVSDIRVGFEDCRQVYFPNAFSPDGDGINDSFLPFDGGDVGRIHYLGVFDRWGGLVHEARDFLPNDFSKGWDGMVDGKAAMAGVYTWLARVEFRDGYLQWLQGDVHLLR